MFGLVFQNSTSDKKYISKFFERILLAGIKELKRQARPGSQVLPGKNVGISVSLIGEKKIKELNNKHRKKNKVTDVLSFPMIEKLTKKLKAKSYKLEAVDLGDIFICLSFAKKQAKRENVSIEKELAQLTAHGFLHLFGYDHEKSKSEAKKMFNLEVEILKASGF